MIVYGVCAGPSGKFGQIAQPSINRLRTADDVVVALFDQRSIALAYNRILDHAGDHDDLEAVVLIHDDVEILDPGFADKVRAALSEDDVAIIGVTGASSVASLEWWVYDTHGRVREDRAGVVDFGGGTHDVDMVDGLFLGMSPWAVRNLRFDEGYQGFHGYDADVCFAARAAGRRVIVTDIDLAHRTLGGFGDKDTFDAADRRFQAKWRLRPPQPSLWRRLRCLLSRLRSTVTKSRWSTTARPAADAGPPGGAGRGRT